MALGRIALVSIKGIVREVEREISGVMSISLEDAVQNGLLSLTAYGGTEQNGTPTPTTPIDIVSNNGVIKFSKNMANVNAQTALVGYYISTTGVVSAEANNRMYQEFIPCKPNTKYTLSMSSAVYFVSISEYSTANDSGFIVRNASGSGVWTQYTITTGANTNYLRFGANIDRSEVTLERVLAIDWQLEIGDTPTPYHEYVEGGVYVDGTTETISSTLSTATAEMLLKVGDYQDVQSILDGVVTRNVGVKVFDGTESFNSGQASGVQCVQIPKTALGISSDTLPNDSLDLICTHYKAVNGSDWAQSKLNTIKVGSGYLFFNTQYVQDSASFEAYLAEQYAAGTPVIIVYPLAEETTESVAGQTMNIQAGNNTIEITQASLNTLELSAKYKALPN